MGKASPTGDDLAIQVVEGSFTAAGQVTPAGAFKGRFLLWITGTFDAIVAVEASFDGGANFHQLTSLGGSTVFNGRAVEVLSQPESGVLIRARCSDYTSGTVFVRISQ